MPMRTRARRLHRAGLTKTEVIVIVVVAVAGGMLLMTCLGAGILLPALGKARATARQIKDGTQVRGIHQGLVLFAQNNGDKYPLPSLYDKNNTTINLGEGKPAEGKDVTAHVASILLYNGFFSPEMCVSPAEQNPSIVADSSYAYSSPAVAASPAQALWDPAFSADFTNGSFGNISYAHSFFNGARRALWSNTFQNDQAAIGNRGPEIATVAGQVTALKSPQSTTLLIHGGRTTWEGNIGYNDNHVDFETTLIRNHKMKKEDGTQFSLWDCLFFDEASADPTGTNNLLTIITENGPNEGDAKTIWD